MIHGYIHSALDKYSNKWVILYNQIKTNVNRMESFESIIWNGCSKLSFKTKLKFEMSNSRKMWKYLSFLINSAILDNYIYLFILLYRSKVPKTSDLLLLTEFNYHKYFWSYQTICTILSLKTT